ncbi:MAG: hypothetical protein ABR499_17545 [Gemmatimonadaceae bacterium]
MPLFARWRAERDLRRRSVAYVATLLEEPADADVRWLAESATRGDVDHARWELRYARRAVGLIVAQRDALDDRTGSSVGRALADAFERDPNVATDRLAVARHQFNARLGAYRDVLTSRPPAARTAGPRPAATQTQVRLGQILLAFAGGPVGPTAREVPRAGEIVTSYIDAAHDALRNAFGAASLPEDVSPSALQRT